MRVLADTNIFIKFNRKLPLAAAVETVLESDIAEHSCPACRRLWRTRIHSPMLQAPAPSPSFAQGMKTPTRMPPLRPLIQLSTKQNPFWWII